MNNTNYGYSPSGYPSPSPYSSTPTGIRTQRPRFGYSAPSMYPRPRSSASKPNPDSFSDSMINNYGSSTSQIDASFNSENGNSYDDSYNSNYYTANESFYSNNQSSNKSMMQDNSMMYDGPGMMRGNVGRGERATGRGGMLMQSSALLADPTSQFEKYPKFNMNNAGEFEGNFQKTSTFGEKNNRPPFTRKFNKAKRMGTKQPQGALTLKCDLCSLTFTSQIPYDMHLQGARHAKKMKAKVALSAVQSPTIRGPTEGDKTFFCELCNVKTNSSLQLQTHLEGSKHKNKLLPKEPKEPKEQSEESSKEVKKPAKPITETPMNGKTNGSVIRPLPPDFGEPQASKMTKYACDVCCVAVNSEVQLQQHLSSKKHQNKIDGKPVSKPKRMKMEAKRTPDTAKVQDVTMAEVVSETLSNEASTKVVGVKTLASSFVHGETLQ